MDPITQRQQTESAKRLLRAYSAEYRRAKKCRKIRAAGAIAFAIAGPVSAVWSITTAAYIAAAAGAWTVIVRVLLKRYENEAQHHAVAIHELFDTEVLGLPWSESLAGRKPADEDILKAARTVADDAKLTARIDAGWFPETPGVPPPVDTLIAQRASAIWGRRQHKLYSRLVLWVLGIVFVVVVALGFGLRMQLSTWLIVFVLPGLPALLDGVELSLSHGEQSAHKREVETTIVDAWDKELQSPGGLTVHKCRQIQDVVFRIRLEPVQIPEWYYNRHRSGDEEAMQSAAGNLAARYRDAVDTKANEGQ
jgi:hypothetical protein